MKKFFTLIAAVVACLSVNAETEIALSGFSAWGDGITYDETTKTLDCTTAWAGGQFTVDVDASAAQYLAVKLSQCPSDVNFNIKGWWGEGLSIAKSITSGSEYFFVEITSDDWAAGQYHIQQLQFQPKATGQIVIDKVSIISQAEYEAILAGTGIDPTALWTGSNDFGNSWSWDSTLGFSGAVFSDVKSGESLVFEFTPGEGDKALKVEFGQWGGSGYMSYYATKANSYNCIPLTDETSYEIPLTADDLTSLQGNGIRVSGQNITLTKIKHTAATFDPTTAISEVAAPAAAQKVVKAVKNGKVVIVKDGAEYNVAGQLVK